MTCVTGPLTAVQILDEVPEIVNLLQANGIESLTVEYGWGCKLEASRLWQDIEVRLQDLVAFIRSSIEQGIYSPGQADLVLQDRDRTFECLFCHESDIHLVTDDGGLITQATRRWMDKGYGGFMAAANENWEPI
jgi:hypothetical protein